MWFGQVVALQAPVSDRESLGLTPGDHSVHLAQARSLISQLKGDEYMPRTAFWAPITAYRYLSLFGVGGDDDFFSSDFTDKELGERLGHVGEIGRENGSLDVLVAFSKKDEYVPDSVEKDALLDRFVSAMNGFEDKERNDETASRVEVATGLMLENGNHNLSEGEGDKEVFVEAVGNMMKLATNK